ncbi:MAG: beta-lactamase domain protein [Gemmatimonadetes bacterium]|nr:beta-lactamase domain protein [Gemmatimonadota bacterium]
MRLVTLGTGTVALTGARVCAGHHVEAGAVKLLLDCGSGVTHRLAELDVPWRAITHVAITHFHTDHIGDLATLVFAWKYGDLPGRSAPLTIIGPPGTAPLIGRLADAFGEWLREPGFPISILEMQPGATLDLGDGVNLRATKVPHTAESVAYSIERGGRRIVYTGDTGYDPMLGEWARGADVLLCECSLPAEMAIPTHLTPEQCGALAAAALPKHLVLTHFYPPVERVDIRAAVAAHYAGLITLADDGSTFEIEED